MKTPELTAPTPDELPALVDRAAQLEAEIKVREDELKIIKKRLQLAALAADKSQPLDDESREGRCTVLTGHKHTVRVVAQSDSIITSFKEGDSTHMALINVLSSDKSLGVKADDALKLFFEPPCKWINKFRDGQKFREAVAERLSKEHAAMFVSLCKAKSSKTGLTKNTISMTFGQTAPAETPAAQ